MDPQMRWNLWMLLNLSIWLGLMFVGLFAIWSRQ